MVRGGGGSRRGRDSGVYIWDDDLAGALGWDGMNRQGIIELGMEHG